MKNLCDYEKTQSATVDLPFGAFKNESSPGQQDGTAIVAEHIQDIVYCLYQVLQLAGVTPNGELEDGNNKTQFISALTNIGILKHSDKVAYNASVLVWTINGSDFILYRSNKALNSDDLSNTESWTKILTIDNRNKINFHVQTNISGGSGSSMPVFCFNSGPVDENGEPALITLSGNTLTQHSPAVCTTADGETYTINEDISLDISQLPAGDYNLFYNPDTGGLEIYNNKIYIQKAEPSDMQINDVWVDISVMPYKAKIKTSEEVLTEVKLVANAVISILLDGGGVTLKVLPYNVLREIEGLKTEKADKDLSNTVPSQSFKDMSVGWCMPDYSKAVDIKSLSSFQCPDFGYLSIYVSNNIGKEAFIVYKTNLSSLIYYEVSIYTVGGLNQAVFFPVQKNEILTQYMLQGDNNCKVMFIPMKGVLNA